MKIRSIILFFAFFISTVAQAETEIKIGVLTDLSGLGAYFGNQTRVGALLAEQELKEQKKNIKIIFEDSALKPPQAVTALQKLLYVDKIDAIYVDFTPIATAISPILKTNKKLMIYSAAARSIADQNEYAFKTYLDYQKGCEVVARELKKEGIKKVAMLKANSEYAELCLTGIKDVYDEVVQYDYNRGDIVSSQVLKIKEKKVEVIFNTSYEGDLSNSIQAATALNYPVRFVSADDTFTKQLMDKYKDRLEGSLSFGLKKLPNEILEKAKKIDGGDKLTDFVGTGQTLVHIEQMYEVIKECGAENINCQVEKLKAAKEDDRIGFKGWDNKIAKRETEIREFRKDGFYLKGSADK